MTTALERLQAGYYNSDPVTEENPGGFGDGGHVVNFPAALDDIAEVVTDLDAKTLLNGVGAPDNGLGKNGDFYVDRTEGAPKIFGPKAAGAWPAEGADLRGIPGLPGDDGADGREIELGGSETHLRWRYVGDAGWTNLIAWAALQGPPGDDGDDGREVELRVSGGYIQWRLTGEAGWTNLVSIASLKGDPGDPGAPGAPGDDGDDGLSVELQKTATHVQWRQIGGAWANLIALADIKGDPGAGSGDVVGPAVVADGRLAVFDGTTGKLLEEGPALGVSSPTSVPQRSDADGRFLAFASANVSVSPYELLGLPAYVHSPFFTMGTNQNLLVRSDYGISWTADNSTTVDGNIYDGPQGRPAAITGAGVRLNAGTAGTGRYWQSRALTALGAHVFSTWLYNPTGADIVIPGLTLENNASTPEVFTTGALTIVPGWRRYYVAGTFASAHTTKTVRVVNGDKVIGAAMAQLDTGLTPRGYRSTGSQAGSIENGVVRWHTAVNFSNTALFESDVTFSGNQSTVGTASAGAFNSNPTTTTVRVISVSLTSFNAATVGTPIRWSPSDRKQGRVWNGAASVTLDTWSELVPLTSGAGYTWQLRWRYQDGAGAEADLLTLEPTSGGVMKFMGSNVVRSVNGSTADAAGNVVIPGGVGQSDLVQLALGMARVSANQQGMSKGWADDFQDTDGVDAAASTNESYNSAGSKSYRCVRASSSAFPNDMTASNAPSPQVASASSQYVGFEAWKAFDGDTTTSYFDTASVGYPFWLRRRLDAARVVTKYKVQCGGDGAPTDWTFRGSNDGSTWTTLDTQTGQNPGSSVGTAIEYTIANTTAYLYYEMLVSAGASYGSIRDLSFTVTTQLAAMSLQSTAFVSALAAPSTAMLTVLASTASGTITVNTNLKGYVSRDNGTTWTQVTLTAGVTVGGITTYEGTATISGQPSGTAMKWKIETEVSGSADISIDGVALLWS